MDTRPGAGGNPKLSSLWAVTVPVAWGLRQCGTDDPRRALVSAQPVHYADQPAAITRDPDGIASALSGARRMAFYQELGHVRTGEAFERLLDVWWCRATSDSRPDREARLQAAREGTLPTTTWAEIARRRAAQGD